MRHAAGELPDGLHLLGLAQLFLQAATVCDVAGHADEMANLTLLIANRRDGELVPEGTAVLPAIQDLARLPADAHERAVAEQILLRLQHALGDKANRTPEEQEFIMTMHSTWEDARDEGRKEGRAHAVLAVFRVRGLAVSDAVRERILAEQDVRKLERWLERAVVAASAEDVIDTPS